MKHFEDGLFNDETGMVLANRRSQFSAIDFIHFSRNLNYNDNFYWIFLKKYLGKSVVSASK